MLNITDNVSDALRHLDLQSQTIEQAKSIINRYFNSSKKEPYNTQATLINALILSAVAAVLQIYHHAEISLIFLFLTLTSALLGFYLGYKNYFLFFSPCKNQTNTAESAIKNQSLSHAQDTLSN